MSKYCHDCNQVVNPKIALGSRIWLIHSVMLVLTFGMWLPILAMALAFHKASCPECGSTDLLREKLVSDTALEEFMMEVRREEEKDAVLKNLRERYEELQRSLTPGRMSS